MKIDKELSHLREPFRGIIEWIYEHDFQKFKETMPLQPFETLRTKERQADCVKRKASKTMKSKHLQGLAVDFVYRDAKGWSWDMNRPEVAAAYKKMREIIDDYPDLQYIKWDWPHIEYSGTLKDIKNFEDNDK